MQAAAPKTYISKRMLERYSEQRRMQQESLNSNNANVAPTVPSKRFTEDEEGQPKSSTLPPIEEEKKELEETKEIKI